MSEMREKQASSFAKDLEICLAGGVLGCVFAAASVVMAPVLPSTVKEQVNKVFGTNVDAMNARLQERLTPLMEGFTAIQKGMIQYNQRLEELQRHHEKQKPTSEKTVQIGNHSFTYPGLDSV